MIRLSIEPDADPSRAFEGVDAAVEAALARAVGGTGSWLQTQVKANAMGRPGPRVQLGDYQGSIQLTQTRDLLGPVATVSTNLPQARRLEFGFFGEDSLGRNYRQPPYPHWRPAIARLGPVFTAELDRALRAARGSE